jgi:AIPR protein
MMNEIPIEILELPNQLREKFTGKLMEAASGTPEARESNFLSRALAAYAVHKLAGCDLVEAANGVVDGGGDGGIDAVFYSANSNTLFLVQSKYINSGRGEPDLGDVAKFKTGIENLLSGKYGAFDKNAAWQERLPQIKADQKYMVQACLVLVYSGINTVSEDKLQLFEDVKQRFAADEEDEYINVQICGLTTVYDWLIDADLGIGVDQVEMKLLKPGWLRKPYETVYGLLPLKDLADLFAQYGKRLVGANIRAYKGKTEVNEKILATIQDEPESFFYLNNGLTAYCDRLQIETIDRDRVEFKRITAYGFSIVNGAQTLGAVAEFSTQNADVVPDGNVFIKVISLEKCEDERIFAGRITRSTNFQNEIDSQDFVALDEQQARIAAQLLLSGVTYHYRSDVDTPKADEANFTLREATTAAACLAKVQFLDDFCAKILKKRSALWSFEEVYGEREVYRSSYAQVFRADRSARTLWRAVQMQRIVIRVMQDNGRASLGIRKAFFESSRWVLLAVVFVQLRKEQGNDLVLSTDEQEMVSRYIVELAERLWTICEAQGYVSEARHFKAVFSDSSDCKRLRTALLASLAKERIMI